MKTLIVLFNLKAGITAQDYEKWAQTTDVPTVKGLKSIDDFKIYQTEMLLGSDSKPPYQYVEVIDVKDMGVFGQEIGTELMKKVAAEFQTFADNPLFILANQVA